MKKNLVLFQWSIEMLFFLMNVNWMYTHVMFIFLIWGPYGERDEQLLFVQKVIPDTDQIFVRMASSGKRWVHFLVHHEVFQDYVNYVIPVAFYLFCYFTIFFIFERGRKRWYWLFKIPRFLEDFIQTIKSFNLIATELWRR